MAKKHPIARKDNHGKPHIRTDLISSTPIQVK
jgi:hypothetical protein